MVPWARSVRRRAAGVTRGEDGFYILMSVAVLFTTILLISMASAMYFSTTTNNSAYHQSRETSARALAEAGINNAASVLSAASNPTVSTLLPTRTDTYDTGRVTWSGTYNAAATEWTITSTGTVTHSLQGNGSVTSTLTAKIPVTTSTGGGGAVPAWSYVFATGSSAACDMAIYNTVTIASPIYVNGDLCLYNSATITGSSTIVNVSGKASLANPQNAIGQPTNKGGPVAAVHIPGGCSWKGAAYRAPCTTGDDVYATVSDKILNPNPLTPPTVDWDGWYAAASPGPRSPCQTSSGTPPVFDNNSIRDASVPTVNLTPASSYSCTTASGRLTWSAFWRTLTVSGTIFIDGSATIDGAGAMVYSGQAALYLSGTFLLRNSQLCGYGVSSGACTAGWNQSTDYLAIGTDGVVGGVRQTYGITLTSAAFQGGLYSTAGVDASTTSDAEGGIIGSVVLLSQKATVLGTSTVPAGMMGNSPGSYSVGRPYSYSG